VRDGAELGGAQMRRFPRAGEALVRKVPAAGAEIRWLRHASAHPENKIGAGCAFAPNATCRRRRRAERRSVRRFALKILRGAV
jgi:hypothetical protein